VSNRGWTRERPARKPLIVLAGEDSNDRKVLRTLLEAICPAARGRIVEINDIVRLRAAGDSVLADRVKKLADHVRARAEREQAEVAYIFIQEDFDTVDSPQRDITRTRVQNALQRNFPRTYYILAAWEVEAWLLLFPDAITAVNSSWVVPRSLRGIDTGRVTDPKRTMMEKVSTSRNSRYRETDAPKVIGKVTELNLQKTLSGSNRSYSELLQTAEECCRTL
jgi:hypothetical protein